jgi:bifunctional UDP-N-acetylglucosamine pyrophosphorylase/glucosamine-1-phosphate N-acetyltransferase
MEQGKSTIQAVILAAGKGTRMLPLTETRPKPMQEVLGKNLIEWKLEALPETVCEVVIVIGYQGDQIKGYFGDSWKEKPIRYVVQEELNGTAGALWAARDLLRGRFLVMMGDDLYAKEDIVAICTQEFAVGVQKIVGKEIGGEMIANADGDFAGIIEEKHYIEDGLQNVGLYILDERIFDYPLTPIGGSSTEFGLPHTLIALAKTFPIHMLLVTKWLQVTTPDDLVRAEEFVKSIQR